MESEQYITKKDLLVTAGISSGQLYRWKREGLIPEEWFIKKASRTGQETYLPKKQILERIEYIRDHKKQHTIDEMSALLGGKKGEKTYSPEEIRRIREIHPDILKVLVVGEYSQKEAAFLVMLSDSYQKGHISRTELGELLSGCAGFFSKAGDGSYFFRIYRINGRVFGMLLSEGKELLEDRRLLLVDNYSLDETAGRLAEEYPDSEPSEQ